jgi:hypothetical protein
MPLKLVEQGEELRLVADQFVVVGQLEAHPSLCHEAVADRVAEERSQRVMPHEDLVVAPPDAA